MRKRVAAVCEYIAGLWRRKLERQLAGGYVANAAQARQMAEELAHVGTDLP